MSEINLKTHEIIIVAYSGDLALLFYNLLSLKKNWKGHQNITIVIEDNNPEVKKWCEDTVCEILPTWNTNILMAPDKIKATDGWHRQQILKLWASSISKFEYVIVLDCKNILVNSFSFEENFQDDVLLINLYDEKHINDYDRTVWEHTCKLFKKKYAEVSKCFCITPFIWRSDVLNSMIDFLRIEKNFHIWDQDCFSWYESSIYWIHAQDIIPYCNSKRNLTAGQYGGIGSEFTLSESDFQAQLDKTEAENIPIFNLHRFHATKENLNTLNLFLMSKKIINKSDISVFENLFRKYFCYLRPEVQGFLNWQKNEI